MKIEKSENVNPLVMSNSFVTPWSVARQTPLSMGFPRQGYWSGCHFLLQGIFPTQEWNPGLKHCGQTPYRLSHRGNPPYVADGHHM